MYNSYFISKFFLNFCQNIVLLFSDFSDLLKSNSNIEPDKDFYVLICTPMYPYTPMYSYYSCTPILLYTPMYSYVLLSNPSTSMFPTTPVYSYYSYVLLLLLCVLPLLCGLPLLCTSTSTVYPTTPVYSYYS